MATSTQLGPQQPFPLADLQPGLLQKEDLISAYLTLDPSVTPCHAGVHRIPVSKLEKVKAKLDDMVNCGKLKKID